MLSLLVPMLEEGWPSLRADSPEEGVEWGCREGSWEQALRGEMSLRREAGNQSTNPWTPRTSEPDAGAWTDLSGISQHPLRSVFDLRF